MKVVFTITSLILVLFVCYRCVQKKQELSVSYVGSESCGNCHAKELGLYKESHHFHAMDTASLASVKGDFNNSTFIYYGDTTYFYKRGTNFFVKTIDSFGVKKEFQVLYTLGWYPLQQYLVMLNGGRIQVLPFCWDTREKSLGGQRWFHIYSKEKILPGDELFWTGINQNWNYMCADCHTTNFNSNYNYAENQFHSTWQEKRVSCESCHGPASAHIEWTKEKQPNAPYKGFLISLAAKHINWRLDTSKKMLMPDQVIMHDTLIETCARCHARATRFTDRYVHGESFLQSHIPAVIDTVNYYIDGQIKEEDYEYASFLQSKMYSKGVTCINCHDAHSMKIKASGNELCTSCHTPAKYDGPQHSFHKQESEGNKCVSCHMPTTTYMGIDKRLDHSIRIPRPDQSLITHAPNACNKCHTNKSVEWAATNFTTYFGKKVTPVNYTTNLWQISRYVKGSNTSLLELLQNKQYPAIIRSSALQQYGLFASPMMFNLIQEDIKSPNAFTRLNALTALRNYPVEMSQKVIEPMLYDPVISIRMEALLACAPFYDKLSKQESEKFNELKVDYIKQQEQLSHRPEGFFNRALLLNMLNENQAAEELYKECINRFPLFIPAYSNLIEVYRSTKRENEAKNLIDAGIQRFPQSGYIHYAKGMWYIRNGETDKGVSELKDAAMLSPSDVQLVYGYAVALFSTGKQQDGLKQLLTYVNAYGNRPLILDGLISMYADNNNPAEARRYSGLRSEMYGY